MWLAWFMAGAVFGYIFCGILAARKCDECTKGE